jgi:hypothetical protein
MKILILPIKAPEIIFQILAFLLSKIETLNKSNKSNPKLIKKIKSK